jgi:hypothetical protein
MTGKNDGSCAPVLNGNDPHEACADETTANPAKPCGNDGTCDGKGACRKAGAGQKCGSASCSADGNTFTPEPKCDGNGTCTPATPQNCAPYQCAVTGCAKNCSKQADCDTGTYCNLATNTCASQKTNGTTASQTYECQSGIIANGVCCKTECGECNSCSTGTCTPITAGTACGGGGKVCVSGICQAGCWITGQFASSGATSSTNSCQSCQPAISTSGWSTKADGAECGTGKTCLAGACKCTTGTDCGTGGCINVNGNDNNHCGSCTNVCPAGQSCGLGKCSCVKGASACGGCLAWDFESGPGTTNGWVVGGEPGALAYGNGATNVQISSTKTNPNNSNSRYSLAVPVAIYDSLMVPAAVAVPLCQAGTPINLAGYTLTAAVYLAGPAFDWNGGMHVNSYGPGGNYDWGIQMFDPLKNNDWNYLNYTFTQSIQVDHVSIQLDANKYWVGTMYIDDVTITGP